MPRNLNTFGSALVPLLAQLGISIYLSFCSNLEIIGFLGVYFTIGLLGIIAYKVWNGVYSTWIGVRLGWNVNLRKMGKWAVVTGATDGIGLAIARQLARHGLNVVLMSRSLEKLEGCAKEIERRFKVKTKIIQVDFSQDVFAYEKNVDKELEGLEIGTLINNVGMTYPSPEEFHRIASADFVNKMINLNVTAVTMMTRAVLPGMLERGKGVVVNVGTIISSISVPYFSLYSSTKAFMQSFTLNLEHEYKSRGILFQYQCPGYVTTKISKIRKPNLFIPTPKEYAIKALNSIGMQQNSAIWTPQRFLIPIFQAAEAVIPQTLHSSTAYTAREFWLFAKKLQMQRDPDYSIKID